MIVLEVREGAFLKILEIFYEIIDPGSRNCKLHLIGLYPEHHFTLTILSYKTELVLRLTLQHQFKRKTHKTMYTVYNCTH